jgi:hypothetical protein
MFLAAASSPCRKLMEEKAILWWKIQASRVSSSIT